MLDLSRPDILVFLFTTVSGLLLWAGWLILRPGGFPGRNRSVDARWGVLDVIAIGFFWMAAQSLALGGVLAVRGVPPDTPDPDPRLLATALIAAGIAQLLAVAAGLTWLSIRYGHRFGEFGLSGRTAPLGIPAGLAGFCMWVPLVWTVQALLVRFLPYSHPAIEGMMGRPTPLVIFQTWFLAILVAPLAEEILFRGVLQGWLQRWPNRRPENRGSLIFGESASPHGNAGDRPIDWMAILLTSLVFAAAHYSQGPAPVSLFVLSLGIGYLYQRTGNLTACIVMHMILNTITLTLVSLEIPAPG